MENLDPKKALENNLRLIELQLEKIHEQIEQRKALSERILAKLQKQLNTYTEIINDPLYRANHAKDKAELNQLIREAKRQICIEEKACWNDLQKLSWEKRKLEREKAELEFNLKLLED